MPSQPPFSLLETMRGEHGIALLGRHLSRAEKAATALGFRFDESRIRGALTAHEDLLDSDRVYRVRLTIDQAGVVGITSQPLDASQPVFRTVTVHATNVQSTDLLRGYKTTDREPYEAAYKLAVASGSDEAILINERGEVAEGTRTNVWVRRDKGWLTPPLSSGCLPGVYREHMLETWENAHESVLSVDDLMNAEQVGLSNAVHGFVPAVVEREH